MTRSTSLVASLSKDPEALMAVMEHRFDVLSETQKDQIRQFFNSLNIKPGSYILWGRLSGANDGAHVELDSSVLVWSNLSSILLQEIKILF